MIGCRKIFDAFKNYRKGITDGSSLLKSTHFALVMILFALPAQTHAASKMLPSDKLAVAAEAIGCAINDNDSLVHRCILKKLRENDNGQYKYMNPTDIVGQFYESIIDARSSEGSFSEYPYVGGGISVQVSTTKYLKALLCRDEETVRISFPQDLTERIKSPAETVATYAGGAVISMFRGNCITGFPETINITLALGDRDVVTIPYKVQTTYYQHRRIFDTESVTAHAQNWGDMFVAELDSDGGEKASVAVAEVSNERLEYLCRPTGSPEALIDNVREGMGLEFAGLKDPTITAIHQELDNKAGLRVGDRLVHVSGYEDLLIGKIYMTLCQHRQSALAMIERDGDYFEILLSPGAATKLDAYATDFTVTNPFEPVNADKVFGSDGPMFYNPVFARIFDGNFENLDEKERATLIAILNVSLSLSPDMSVSTMTRGKKALTGLRKIHGSSATACWPYGRTSFEVERFLIRTVTNNYGAVLSQAKTELGEKTLYFDQKLANAIMEKWKVAMEDFGVIPQFRALVDRQSCFSAEYRMLYNRLYELAGLRQS